MTVTGSRAPSPTLAATLASVAAPRVVAALVLVVASYAFRLPPLLNARSTNSDAAVVGLQAMHMLRGELSPFLWGSGYQTSADALVATLFFRVLGATPFALMFSALTLHVVATCLVFAMLRRRFDPWQALLLTMPLVVSPSSVHSYALYPPRQASLTLALAAFFVLDRASARSGAAGPTVGARARLVFLFAGGLLMTLAVSADPYPLLLVPATTLFGVLVACDGAPPRATLIRRIGAFATGAVVGIVPFEVLHRLAGAKSGPMGFTMGALSHHWSLLVRECLPWALSWKVYYARNVMDYAPWDAPVWFPVLGIVGALLVLAMVVHALVAALRGGAIDDPVRRIALSGALVFPLAIAAFLVSVMVMDHFSMRYLAALTLALPFAAAASAQRLGTKLFAVAFVPHLLASLVGGWVGYGPFVRGAVPVRETPELKDDYALFDLLRARDVHHAKADYWASYRLTLLSRERLIVVPTNVAEDRYAPHRAAVDSADVIAYIWDPGRSREPLDEAERAAGADAIQVDKIDVGVLRVFIARRR